MFTEYVCDSPWDNRSHRGWTTLISLAVQTLAAAILLLIPLIYTSGLPQLQFMQRLIAPTAAAPPAAPLQTAHMPTHPTVTELTLEGRPIAPASIPRTIPAINDALAAPQIPGVIPDGTSTRGTNNAVLNAIIASTVGITPSLPPTRPVTRATRTSQIMEALLIRRVQPEYPAPARQARIQGKVILQAVIAKDGTIENLTVLSGHPMLVKAAIDAVRQWRYRPLFLNGEPVEVDTQITVNFVLGG